MNTPLAMATAARRHPAMKTRLRFRLVFIAAGGGHSYFQLRADVSQEKHLFLLSLLPEPSLKSADLLRRRGPWEMKCSDDSETASLFPLFDLWHPRAHRVFGFPSSHIMTEQLMYT